MQAIQTKFLGPTDHRGARVKAWCDAGSLTLAWNDALDTYDNHKAACRALATRLEWWGDWVSGSARRASFGYVFCRFTPGTNVVDV